MCDKSISNDLFKLKSFLYRYKTEEMSNNKAADDFLPALKFVPDWFLTIKMIKKIDDALFTNDITFINKDANNESFF